MAFPTREDVGVSNKLERLINIKNEIGGNTVLYVKTANRYFRCLYHSWAEKNGFKSKACVTELFNDCIHYKCDRCKTMLSDTSFQWVEGGAPGMIAYGLCKVCDDNNDCNIHYWMGGQFDEFKPFETYNAVVIYKDNLPCIVPTKTVHNLKSKKKRYNGKNSGRRREFTDNEIISALNDDHDSSLEIGNTNNLLAVKW